LQLANASAMIVWKDSSKMT